MEPIPQKTPAMSPETEASFALTTVCHCPTLNEAQMLVSLLDSFGITAIIDSENYFRMLGSMMPGVGGIRVQVRQLDAEAALEILDEGPERPVTKEEQHES